MQAPRAPPFSSACTPLLTPIDLHCIKAAGVTFAVSAIERVIEERARGDLRKALAIRSALSERVGADIEAVAPGSAEMSRTSAWRMSPQPARAALAG